MAHERISTAARYRRTSHDIRHRTIHSKEVEVDGGESGKLDAAIAGQGNGLEKYFREHDRRAAIHVDAAVQSRHVRHEVAEVSKGAFAESSPGCRRVHVDDVGTDRDVNGDRNIEPGGRRQLA